MPMESNYAVDDILRLIRATKTFNLKFIKVGDLEICRSDIEQPQVKHREPITELPAPPEVQQELAEYDQENLLITDPLEYEKRVGNG